MHGTHSKVSQQHKTHSHDLLLCLLKREVTCSRGIMGRSVCACAPVCVCWLWGGGVNVIANLLMSPEACPPPHETDPDRRCCNNGPLMALSPRGGIWRDGGEGGEGGGEGGNMLAVWNIGAPRV